MFKPLSQEFDWHRAKPTKKKLESGLDLGKIMKKEVSSG